MSPPSSLKLPCGSDAPLLSGNVGSDQLAREAWLMTATARFSIVAPLSGFCWSRASALAIDPESNRPKLKSSIPYRTQINDTDAASAASAPAKRHLRSVQIAVITASVFFD